MLLRGLRARVTQAATAPLWLLLLRCVALAALIVGLAGPVLRQDRAGQPAPGGQGTEQIIVLDNGWAAVPDWPADWPPSMPCWTAQHPVRLLATAPGLAGEGALVGAPTPPSLLRGMVDSTRPMPWPTDRAAATRTCATWHPAGGTERVVLISDGLASADDPAFAAALTALGPVQT
jgi:hypothetical protein